MNKTKNQTYCITPVDARFILDQIVNNDVAGFEEMATNIHAQMAPTPRPLPLQKLQEIITAEYPKAHRPGAIFDYWLYWQDYGVEIARP